jgi:hypothetical protein
MGADVISKYDGKYLPQDEINDTYDIKIAAEIERAEEAESTLQSNIASETTRAESAESGLQSAIDTEATTRANADITAVDYDAGLHTLKLEKGDETELTEVLPVASETTDGIMPSADHNQILTNTADIASLQGTGRVAAQLGTDPAQEDLTGAWTAVKGGTIPPEGATVVNLDQDSPAGHVWTYFAGEPDQWIDRGTDVVNLATNTAAGIVKGDASTSGKVYAESDGSMSVNGWDDLNDAVSAKIPLAQKGVANGVATLGTNGIVPDTQLPAVSSLPPDYLTGFELSVDGDGNLVVKPGTARDTTNTANIISGAAITKTDEAWSPGNGGGSVPEALLPLEPNGKYYIIILRRDDGTVDFARDTDPNGTNALADPAIIAWGGE